MQIMFFSQNSVKLICKFIAAQSAFLMLYLLEMIIQLNPTKDRNSFIYDPNQI